MKLVKTLGMLLIMSPFSATQAESGDELMVKPQKCVALHRGQTCYQDVSLQWRQPTEGNYCLYQQEQSEPLQCWENQNQGELNYEQVSDKNVRYLLRRKGDSASLATVEVKVAWVYKTRRNRNGWRLF